MWATQIACLGFVAVTGTFGEYVTVTEHVSACAASYTPGLETDASSPGLGEISLINLPPNLGVQFGGVDATGTLTGASNKRTSLFKLQSLNESDTSPQHVYLGSGTTSFDIPNFLQFTWESYSEFSTITGETKAEYLKEYSAKLGLSVGLPGFSLEFKDTFKETSMEETFKKYSTVYSRHRIYGVKMDGGVTELRPYLSDNALKMFAEGDPVEIVNRFGTHYMESATFGGVRRYSHSLDVRDVSVSDELGKVLGLKATAIETNTNGSGVIGDDDKVTSSIYKSMGDVRAEIQGGMQEASQVVTDAWVSHRVSRVLINTNSV